MSYNLYLICNVQAAIGPIALDMARNAHNNNLISHASDVLAISVMAILITAPVGAILMNLFGEYLLRKQYWLIIYTRQTNLVQTVQLKVDQNWFVLLLLMLVKFSLLLFKYIKLVSSFFFIFSTNSSTNFIEFMILVQ